jgi:monoamine oxidase
MNREPVKSAAPTRRQLVQMIGAVAGGAASYRAMAALDLNQKSTYTGPVKLSGDPKGASVLVLGAGVAGLVAALELRAAGYKVQVLEFNAKAGGRNWSLRGGDKFTELGGETQNCQFDKGLYINPGPWRIPYHHQGVLSYCKQLGVAMEPFMQVNYNAYMHSEKAFGGKPQRYRHIQADYYGGVSELLAKAASQDKLDGFVTKEDKEALIESLRSWGALDRDMSYATSAGSSGRRGYEIEPGGGLTAAPTLSKPIKFNDVLQSRLWGALAQGQQHVWQRTIFQPVGGMDQISQAFAKVLGPVIQYNSKVLSIQQSPNKVTVSYVDTVKGGAPRQATADWCVCTIPLSILSQIDINVSPAMKDAIGAVPYSQSVKIGAQFKRRFWEEDDNIYGGISYTDLPIAQISYPSTSYQSSGKGVLLAAFVGGRNAFNLASMAPADRLKAAIEQGSKIHPQYPAEFENGISVAWHRVPWTLGCGSTWNPETRAKHYNDLVSFDGRIVLAGEHASFIGGWQEGAVTSSLDAITRLHQRVTAA